MRIFFYLPDISQSVCGESHKLKTSLSEIQQSPEPLYGVKEVSRTSH